MIFTLICGFVVGVWFRTSESTLHTVFDRAGLALGAEQSGLVALALCLALAALLLGLVGVESYPVLLCLGAACGIARKTVLARISGTGK